MKKKTAMRLLAILLCMATVFLAGCSSAPKTEQAAPAAADTAAAAETDAPLKVKDTIVISNGAVSHLNPYDTDTAAHNIIFWCTHDRLIEVNLETKEITPGLAESWEWTDDTTITFKLRDGVKFHNGETLTSDDVVWSFEQAMQGSSASKLGFIDSVEAPDALTAVFHLNKHYVDAQYIFTQGYCSITNRKACGEDEVYGTKIGTGPYKVAEFLEAEHVLLDRNEEYWGEPAITPHLDFVHLPEAATSQIALENHEVDYANFDIEMKEMYEEDPTLDIRVELNTNIYYLAFNTKKYDTKDKNLRLAIAYATNFDAIRALYDRGMGINPPSNWGINTLGYDESIQPYGRDLEKAKEYLAKVFPNGGGKATISVGGGAQGNFAEIIQANCKEIGLDIEIETMESAALSAKTKYNVCEQEMTINSIGWQIWGDDGRRQYYPESNYNKSVVEDPRIMELLDQACVEEDEAKRIEAYHEIQKINHEECYYLPLFIGLTTDAFTAGLQGVQWDSGSRHKWAYAYIPVAE